MEMRTCIRRWQASLRGLLALALVALLAYTPATAQDLRPGCDSCRIVVNTLAQPLPLTGNWLFTRNDDPHNKDVSIDTQTWKMVLAPGPWRNAYPDGKHFTVGWYRGTFEFAPELVGQEVVMLVDAYMGRVSAYVDGHEVFKRPNNINIDRYYSIQPIPIRFVVQQTRQVVAIRVDTPLMTGIYQLPFELRRYDAHDTSLAWDQFWGGELRTIVAYVVLFFGLFILLVYAKTRARLYLIAALGCLASFPFYAAPADYLLRFFAPEPLLFIHYLGLFAYFLAYVFCQFYYRFTPRLNWILGVGCAASALATSLTVWHGDLDLFLAARMSLFMICLTCAMLGCYQVTRGAALGKPSARVLLVGVLVLTAAGVHDALLAMGAITSVARIFSGMLVYTCALVYVVSSAIANTFVENQGLAKELGLMNENLEELVIERTDELQTARDELEMRVHDRTVDLQLSEDALRALNAALEQRVSERTATLSSTVQALQRTQDDLVQAEKLASLGALVTGVAHELNTPIGNAIVSASTLENRMQGMQLAVAQGNLRKSTLLDFCTDGAQLSALISRSCERAAQLINSFKQVAVDQTSEQRREFDLRNVVQDVMATLQATYHTNQWTFHVDIGAGLVCEGYPGPVGRIVTNLVQNAVLHGFHGREHGALHLSAQKAGAGFVELTVYDDGHGMDANTLSRIFDPFFTTRMGQGGSGLGLSIARNLAIGVLGGNLTARSAPGKGACFTLTMPTVAPRSGTSAV
jgi:signal transduction histidine kinase